MANKNSEAIALVYAESLFELALEQSQADEMEVQFQNVADVIRSDSEILLFLNSPAITNEQKKACLTKAFDGKISDTLLDFLSVVADKNRLDCLLEMQVCFTRLADERAGRIQGVLTTAVELSKKDQARLGEKIGRALKKTIELETVVDASILGGMVLRIGDTLIDGSVKRSLGRLKKQLRVNGSEQLDATQAIVN